MLMLYGRKHNRSDLQSMARTFFSLDLNSQMLIIRSIQQEFPIPTSVVYVGIQQIMTGHGQRVLMR